MRCAAEATAFLACGLAAIVLMLDLRVIAHTLDPPEHSWSTWETREIAREAWQSPPGLLPGVEDCFAALRLGALATASCLTIGAILPLLPRRRRREVAG